jgi:hypothetical protein
MSKHIISKVITITNVVPLVGSMSYKKLPSGSDVDDDFVTDYIKICFTITALNLSGFQNILTIRTFQPIVPIKILV